MYKGHDVDGDIPLDESPEWLAVEAHMEVCAYCEPFVACKEGTALIREVIFLIDAPLVVAIAA